MGIGFASQSQQFGAISAGTQLGSSGSVVFSNSNGVSFGMSGSTRVTASVDAVRQISAGTTNATGSQVVFSNSNGVSFGVNGQTITASITPTLRSRYYREPAGSLGSSVISAPMGSIQYLQLPYDISFSRLDVPMMFSISSSGASNTAAMAVTSGAIVYSRNGSTLNPIVGQVGNTTYSWASNTANFSSIQSGRLVSWGLASTLSAGEYYVYVQLSTATSSVGAATTNLGVTVSLNHGTTYSASGYADFGALSGATTGPVPMNGLISSSVSNTTQTLQMSQITVTGTAAIRANIPIILRNL